MPGSLHAKTLVELAQIEIVLNFAGTMSDKVLQWKVRRQKGDKRAKKEKKTTREADPVGDCTGSAGGEEKGMGRESCESHRETEGRRRRRGEGGGGPRDQSQLTY